MATNQPFLTAVQGTRRFACSAVAVQAIIFNAAEQVLLLSSPTKNRPDEWQIISGALEAAETVLAGVLREVREEAGPHLQVRPLGVVHAQTFHFDHHVPYMIGISYLLASEGGEVQPGDDMRDARSRWWSLEELTTTPVRLHPSTPLWMLHRAVVLYRVWHDQPPVPLQPALDPDHGAEV
jgi:ADP-ribose pyrophosphatase YjhB (NUDIX family)